MYFLTKRAYRCFPEDITYGVLFRDMSTINYYNLIKIGVVDSKGL
jgi:hypothetical protein